MLGRRKCSSTSRSARRASSLKPQLRILIAEMPGETALNAHGRVDRHLRRQRAQHLIFAAEIAELARQEHVVAPAGDPFPILSRSVRRLGTVSLHVAKTLH